MLLTTLALTMLAVGQGPSDWYEPFPAHKVIGNVYYVGSKDLATYLITTPEGHILINSGFDRTVPLIQRSVESLGFKMTDVKFCHYRPRSEPLSRSQVYQAAISRSPPVALFVHFFSVFPRNLLAIVRILLYNVLSSSLMVHLNLQD